MAPERAEFQRLIERRRSEKVHEHRTEIRQIAQAAVPVQALTESTEWNYLLSILQAQIDVLDEMLTTYQRALVTDTVFDPGEMAARKATAMRIKVQMDTLQAVMDLPKQILTLGEKAHLDLLRYDEA